MTSICLCAVSHSDNGDLYSLMIINHSLWPFYHNQCFIMFVCFISSFFVCDTTLNEDLWQEERMGWFEVDILNNVCLDDAHLAELMFLYFIWQVSAREGESQSFPSNIFSDVTWVRISVTMRAQYENPLRLKYKLHNRYRSVKYSVRFIDWMFVCMSENSKKKWPSWFFNIWFQHQYVTHVTLQETQRKKGKSTQIHHSTTLLLLERKTCKALIFHD